MKPTSVVDEPEKKIGSPIPPPQFPSIQLPVPNEFTQEQLREIELSIRSTRLASEITKTVKGITFGWSIKKLEPCMIYFFIFYKFFSNLSSLFATCSFFFHNCFQSLFFQKHQR